MIKRYQSDLRDQQGAIIKPLIPAEREGGCPRITDMREVMNAIFYLLRTDQSMLGQGSTYFVYTRVATVE